MAKTSPMCGAPHPVKPGLFCALTYGHANTRHETPHSDPERAETCERPEGHVGQHGGMGASWPKIPGPAPHLCAIENPSQPGDTCVLPRGHENRAHEGTRTVWPKTAGEPSWDPAPAPQFKPGDRVTLEGMVTGDKPPNTLAQFVPVRLIGTQSSFPVMVLAERLTPVPTILCATRFPGREDAPEAYCRRDPGHEGLHESAEGWRWGTIEQRTDDAHAPAEPRCTSYAPESRGVANRCWGMAGHIGPHRTPSGEWT